MALYVISYIPHYELYVRKLDHFILISSITSMILSLVLNLILIPKFDLLGASLSFLIAYTSLLLMKYYFYKISNK
ncbi:polysaccharide biosynthesis C-terminal domain-containing protein [Bacillus circulans]|nr:polysaccharide biosynthesis C-terminal domain-containing protein [Niallia circulans]